MSHHDVPDNPGLFPRRVTLELTNHCNLNCTFCPRRFMEKERGYMDTGLAMRLIDEMAEHEPVSLVPFFRGESLLHPAWYEILTHAKSRGVDDIQFTTNASLLSQENTEKILGMGLGFISFSLDTVDRELYNKHRRGADFTTTRDNVLHFIERRDSLGAPTRIQVSAVDTREHHPGMERFVAYWRPRVERVRVYVEHSTNGNPGSIDEALPDFEQRRPCHKLYTDMIVYWNGETAVCNHDWTRLADGRRIGNVEEDGIAAVWRSEPYETLRRAHQDGVYSGLKPCENCDHWKMYYMKAGYLGRTYARFDAERESA